MLRGNVIYGFGIITAFLGVAGMAEAITEHGSFFVSSVVFSIGFVICLVNMKGDSNGRS